MENHPIPQDITGFQFKLVGNMTIKQFIYLSAGVVLAWFTFFILPIFLIIRLPLSLFFLGFGISLAFVPVDGRPLDTMIINLIKALFAPTQYIYQKDSGDLSSQISPEAHAQTLVNPPHQAPKTPAGQTLQQTIRVEPKPAAAIQAQVQPQPSAPSPPPPAFTSASNAAEASVDGANAASQPLATPVSYGPVIELTPSPRPVLSGNLDDLVNEKEQDEARLTEEEGEKVLEDEKKLEDEVSTLTKKLEEAKALENTETSLASLSLAHRKTQELEKLLEETLRQKNALEGEIVDLKAKLEGHDQEKFAPGTVPALKQTQRVRKVPPGMEKSVGLPSAPQDPNLITGIVKDPRGNPLPNIIVEVKDIEDNPVRAFKTNGLGQFASATSLSNGKYIVSFDDSSGQNKFDAVQMEASGVPIMPLEIISIDAREVLRRELFN